MGAVTFLIGCLPSYASIGALSPTLLITLRFMQGFMVGGEWSGAMLMVIEHASDKHRGLLSALSQTGDLQDSYWQRAHLSSSPNYRKNNCYRGAGEFHFC